MAMEMEVDADEEFVPVSQRNDAPLANILRSEYQEIDPRYVIVNERSLIFLQAILSTFFPSFKRKGILRFSRLFGANPKTLTANMIWWPSRTFRTKVNQPNEELAEFALNLRSPPKRSECVQDEIVR